jgi:PKD domain
MFTSRFPSRITTLTIVFMLALSSVTPAYAAPSNDNFVEATQITSLPFSVNADTTGATFEVDEPRPECSWGYSDPLKTVWFAYTPLENVTVTARTNYYGFPPLLAIYTADSPYPLSEIACGTWSSQLTIRAQAGVTYYFQLSGLYGGEGTIPFSLEVTPPPQVNINYYPGDPSIFDNVSFSASVYDPAYIYGNTFSWTISDGITSDQSSFYHQFASDGDYPISLTFTTYDGRSASASQVVQVRTRDIAINKLSLPQTARVNQTKAINVDITNKRYSDDVQIRLFKGLPSGEQLIGTLTIFVPARATRPTTFKFSYTFTSQDAQIGKVTFRAEATLMQGRDALPLDNTAIGTTLVTK